MELKDIEEELDNIDANEGSYSDAETRKALIAIGHALVEVARRLDKA